MIERLSKVSSSRRILRNTVRFTPSVFPSEIGPTGPILYRGAREEKSRRRQQSDDCFEDPYSAHKRSVACEKVPANVEYSAFSNRKLLLGDTPSRRSERGVAMVGLSAILLFSFVALLALTQIVNRNIYTARQSHRLLLQQQAAWIAEGAVERAVARLAATPEMRTPNEENFTIRLAPLFIDSELLVQVDLPEGSWPPSVNVDYGFSIQSTEGFTETLPTGQRGFLITGRASMPYGKTHLAEDITHLGYRTNDGKWKTIPVVPSE